MAMKNNQPDPISNDCIHEISPGYDLEENECEDSGELI
jgi:hypothetical protein